MTIQEMIYASPEEALEYAKTKAPGRRTQALLLILQLKIHRLYGSWDDNTVSVAERLRLMSDVADIAHALEAVFSTAANELADTQKEDHPDANES